MSADQVNFVIVVTAAVVLIAWAIYWDFRKKRMEHEERRLMIEKGMEPSPFPPPRLSGWPGVKHSEDQLKYAERRLLIEKGLEVPPLVKPLMPEDYLRRGLIGVCLGIGFATGYLILKLSGLSFSNDEDWLAAFSVLSPVVTLFGLANLVHYQMTKSRRPFSGGSASARR
jgi:hypothetical protein